MSRHDHLLRQSKLDRQTAAAEHEARKAERARRKACHGDWTPCENHENPNGTKEN